MKCVCKPGFNGEISDQLIDLWENTFKFGFQSAQRDALVVQTSLQKVKRLRLGSARKKGAIEVPFRSNSTYNLIAEPLTPNSVIFM